MTCRHAAVTIVRDASVGAASPSKGLAAGAKTPAQRALQTSCMTRMWKEMLENIVQRGLRVAAVAFGAAFGSSAACSLFIEFEDRSVSGDAAPPSTPPELSPEAGAPISEPDSGHAPDAGADADAEGDDAEPVPGAKVDLTFPPPLSLAFIEDSDEEVASLKVVDARPALDSTAVGEASWRRTLAPLEQTGDALDFAWSPDGTRIAVRYRSLDRTLFAFFDWPAGSELVREELQEPASQPILDATARYQWSPDGRTLVAEFTSREGAFLSGYSVDAARARPVPPVRFSAALESLAWFSSDLLMAVQPSADGREVIALGVSGPSFSSQRALPTTFLPYPLELRHASSGVVGAMQEANSPLYFWPAAVPPEFEVIYAGAAFVSAGHWFVATADDELFTSTLYAIGDVERPLATLANCAEIITWGDGPEPASLRGSTLACLRTADASAIATIYTFGDGASAEGRVLDDAALRADLGGDTWRTGVRAFSSSNRWLALTSAERDFFIDLREEQPRYHSSAALASGATARQFSPNGRYLLAQRGEQLSFVDLEPGEDGPPVSYPLAAAEAPPATCSTAIHVSAWCGAPGAATGSGRWSARDDVAVILLKDSGLQLLEPTEDGYRPVRPVSTCGANCVRQYAFNL